MASNVQVLSASSRELVSFMAWLSGATMVGGAATFLFSRSKNSTEKKPSESAVTTVVDAGTQTVAAVGPDETAQRRDNAGQLHPHYQHPGLVDMNFKDGRFEGAVRGRPGDQYFEVHITKHKATYKGSPTLSPTLDPVPTYTE